MVTIECESPGLGGTVDVTDRISAELHRLPRATGIATVLVDGSTCGLCIMRFEPGTERDLGEALNRISPAEHEYHHRRTTGDGNGEAHVKSVLVSQSVAVPVIAHSIALAKLHRIVLWDFDHSPSQRKLYIDL